MSSVSASTAEPVPQRLRLRDAIGFWLKLGFISFGGPAGQIAIMHEELVERRRWISEGRFLHALNYCMVLPGPEAQQLATYIGWLMHRTAGGVIAGVLFVLPSLLLLILLSWLYIAFGHLPVIEGLFYGIKPAVTAIVLHAAWRIGSRTLRNAWAWSIAATAFLAIFLFNVPFPLIVLAAAVAGFIAGRVSPGFSARKSSHGGGGKGDAVATPALIDDHTPPPPHARFRWSRLWLIVAIGVALWALPMLVLGLWFGWQHTFTQMGWFFTTAALMTFGGAYAVLPYVYQGAVVHYAWVTPVQMIDGLALGETTPGPLIMVVAFVGFLGGYGQALLGPDHAFLAGAAAATLVTWFTFLPSFLFILAGGPMVESTHGDVRFTAPLTGITAAVVGVIVNLALFFGQHVLWPEGFDGRFDVVAAVLAVAAAVALFRFRRNVLEVIGVCAALGLAARLLQLA